MRKILVLLLFVTSLCFAQTPLTVTGTIQAPSGAVATNGFVQFTLSPANSGLLYFVLNTTVIAPQTVKCTITPFGQLASLQGGACTLWGNDQITPANSLYNVAIAPNSRVSNQINNMLIATGFSNLNNPKLIAPQPVIGTVINTSPLVVESVVPGLPDIWNLGSLQKPFANLYVDNIFCSGAHCAGGFVPPNPANFPGDINVPGTTSTVNINVTNNTNLNGFSSTGPGSYTTPLFPAIGLIPDPFCQYIIPQGISFGGVSGPMLQFCAIVDPNNGMTYLVENDGIGSPNFNQILVPFNSFGSFQPNGASPVWNGVLGGLDWATSPRSLPGIYVSLPTCNSSIEGTASSVTDSTTNTWGANVSGGGSNHVLAYCDGTNWTVMGK